jgi:hypothetical protein
VSQEEIAVFVKAGSVIPRKYNRRMSALEARNDNYLLDIYPSLRNDSFEATGYLYLDDGESYDYRNKTQYSLIEFTYSKGALFVKPKARSYFSGQSFLIDEVSIYGIEQPPTKVTASSSLRMDSSNLKFTYNEETKQVVITNFLIHMVADASNDHPLIEVAFAHDVIKQTY